jgi:transcription initiation factor IIE alpha subunit
MKTLMIALTAFFAFGSAVSAQTTATVRKNEVQKTVYSCPMHPKVVSDKKGKCSKCGMDLEATKETVHTTTAKVNQTTTVAKSKYVCTMDGATADKPGKCPKCGMALTERKSDKK